LYDSLGTLVSCHWLVIHSYIYTMIYSLFNDFNFFVSRFVSALCGLDFSFYYIIRIIVIYKYCWSPVENRRIYKSRFVCPSVRVCVTDYLGIRSEDFSEIWYEVGGKKYKKHSTAVFLKKFPVFSKTALFCQKNAKNMVFDTLCKNDSDNFSKNLIKCVNKWPLCFGQKL